MNFENIIGIGNFGSIIAKQFGQYDYEYKTIGLELDNFKLIKMKNPKNYELCFDDFPDLTNDFIQNFIPKINSKNILLIIDSSDPVSFSSLRISQMLVENGFEISILCLIPEKIFVSSGEKNLIVKSIFNILQQMTRSGCFKTIYLISCESLRNINEEITIINYREKIAEILSYSCHVLNVFENQDPIIGDKLIVDNVCRIATIGILDKESLEEMLFYDLKNVRQGSYIYGIKEDANLIKRVSEKKGLRRNVVHSFYESPFEQYYCELFTNFVQEDF